MSQTCMVRAVNIIGSPLDAGTAAAMSQTDVNSSRKGVYIVLTIPQIFAQRHFLHLDCARSSCVRGLSHGFAGYALKPDIHMYICINGFPISTHHSASNFISECRGSTLAHTA